MAEAEVAADGVDAAGLWKILSGRWPRLSAHRGNTRLARNGAYAAEGEVFAAGDEVALLPPVSGG